ncbi:SMP-30/gluconolactonase/LRE family protein [Agaribacterium sp. ZY112]|uniref:SMP-30/gluconolactonase/LRE family protein n=1 Tax=Agaribacterium sp. ZY112 TaxID=3233574 RepID=UPI003525A23E
MNVRLKAFSYATELAAASFLLAVASLSNAANANTLRLEAENFVASGGTYADGQPSPVSTYAIGGGSAINYVNRGDYVEYELQVTAAGAYALDYFVGTSIPSGAAVEFQLLTNGSWLSQGSTIVPTGSWDRFVSLEAAYSVDLEQGVNRVRLIGSGSHNWQWNMDAFELSLITGASPSPSLSPSPSPLLSPSPSVSPIVSPSPSPVVSPSPAVSPSPLVSPSVNPSPETRQLIKVEAEDFESVGGSYVDGQVEPIGTYSLGNLMAINYVNRGDYADYEIDVIQAGEFELSYHIGSAIVSGSAVEFLVYEQGRWLSQGQTTVPAPGWDNFVELAASHKAELPVGRAHIRVRGAGTHDWQWNLESFTLLSPLHEQDDDRDGIVNSHDQCANTASGETVDTQGCSDSQRDSDHDGVSDLHDDCANTTIGDAVNAQGCSDEQLDGDDDLDGVRNSIDLCALTPSGEAADASGCSASQRDTDDDGISDALDRCPSTLPEHKLSVDSEGCYIDPADTTLLYAINSGGQAYLAADGIAYQADEYFSGGSTFSSARSIVGSADDPLFQTERYDNFSYSLPVSANTSYTIKLQFAEIYWQHEGERIFSVDIEGEAVAQALDLVAATGARDVAYSLTHHVDVVDGSLDIVFSNSVNVAKLSAFTVTIRDGDIGQPVTDSDADGVSDSLDLCAHSPSAELVDSDGCSASQLAGACYKPNSSSVLAADAELMNIAPETHFAWTEGPAADVDGNLFFTDIPNSRIHRYGTDGQLTTFMSNTARANGLFFNRSGQLLLAQGDLARIAAVTPSSVTAQDPDGDLSSVVSSYNGSRFNEPNDMWLAPNGDMYFTDPCYNNCGLPQGSEQVYLLKHGQNMAIRLTNNLVNPNGIIGTADGKVLFISDANGDKKVYKYHIGDDGLLSQRSVFANIGGDGMTIDCENNVYITARDASSAHYVSVRAPNGVELERINLSETPSNITFAGSDLDTLFITASTSVYSIKARVRGLRTQ